MVQNIQLWNLDLKKLFSIILLLFFIPLFAQNYQQQIRHWQQQPESADKYFELGKLYDETGNYRRAIIHYQKALEYAPDELPVMSKLTRVYEGYGQIAKAIAISEKILSKDSLNYLEKYHLARLYAKSRRKPEALKILHNLIKIDPGNAHYHYKTGLYETDMNRRLDAFLRAYRLDSMHRKNLYMLIKNYKAIKFIDSAEYYIDKGLAIYPQDTKFLRQKVIADYRHKKYKDMLHHLKRLDSLHYEKLFVYKNTGLAYLMTGDWVHAENYLKKALGEERGDPVNYYYLGLLYEKKNDLKKAQQYFKLAIKLKQPSLDKEYFELGMIAKKQRKLKKAIAYFKDAHQNNPKNPDALLQLAMMSEVYYKSPEQAIGYYEKYLDLFRHTDKEKEAFVKHKLKALKEKLFLSR